MIIFELFVNKMCNKLICIIIIQIKVKIKIELIKHLPVQFSGNNEY